MTRCCECHGEAKRAITFARLADGTVRKVCAPCWNRHGYDRHFSDRFKATATALIGKRDLA